MRTLFLIPFAAAALVAQTAGSQQAEPAKPPAGTTQAAEAAPQPADAGAEPALEGSVEVGYRWNGDLKGSLDAYRSVINLGEGPRLLNFDLRFVSPTQGGWLDRLTMRGAGWGGDPYNYARLEALANRKYRLTFDHRAMAYFNALPSFANPKIQSGILQTQSAYDVLRRLTDVELELRPGTNFIPYVGYAHNSGSGRGVQTFESIQNEYPVGSTLRDSTQNYRGGVRIETARFHITLEQGKTTFKDDQSLYTADRNPGNRTSSFLGQNLFLTNLTQAYGIRGDSIYSRGLLSARPAEWIDVYANFLWSQPEVDNNYLHVALGNFAETNPIAFFNTTQLFLASAAKQPHTNANGGFELRPFRRVRIIESFLTDRFHTSGYLAPATVAIGGTGQTDLRGAADRFVMNYNQQQIEALVDVTRRLTIRGGHKYVWGDTTSRAPTLSGRTFETGELKLNAGLGGITYRVNTRFSLYADAEIGRGDRAYFQTSLRDYDKVRLRGSWQPIDSLTLTGNWGYLNNTNPGPERTYEFQSRHASAAILWNPPKAKYLRFMGEYARTTLWSDVLYVVPQRLTKERSFYRENGHSATSLIELGPAAGRAPRFSFGGSLWYGSGSRPTHFYQPMARVGIPIVRHMDWNVEWRYFSMAEPYFIAENFQQHQAIFSVRFY